MPWSRLDDTVLDHPKVCRAGVLGWALWTAAIVWSNRNLTDGLIPRNAIGRLLPFDTLLDDAFALITDKAVASKLRQEASYARTPSAADVADALVEIGLFDAHPDGWQVHDFNAFNPSRASVLLERSEVSATKAKAGRLGGLRRAERMRETREASSEASSALAPAKQTRSPDPDPDPRRDPAPREPEPLLALTKKSNADRDRARASDRAEKGRRLTADVDAIWRAHLAEGREPYRPAAKDQRDLIRQRLVDSGIPRDHLLAAARGIWHDPWCRENNAVTLRRALKDGDAVDQYARLAPAPAEPAPAPVAQLAPEQAAALRARGQATLALMTRVSAARAGLADARRLDTGEAAQADPERAHAEQQQRIAAATDALREAEAALLAHTEAARVPHEGPGTARTSGPPGSEAIGAPTPTSAAGGGVP